MLKNSSFIGGQDVEMFEKEFAQKMCCDFSVSCGNGTDALHIALKALKITVGDEVIVPAHTWFSTSEVVASVGATLVFCDTEEHSCLIDPEAIEQLITKNTKCIIPVHLFGQSANMSRILDIAKRYDLKVIEDCAQAHLAQHKDCLVGTMGDIGTFSFYPGKNLGAMGDAGGLVTNDKKMYLWMKKYAKHGSLKKGAHEFDGINSRLDTFQAKILRIKLRHLTTYTDRRRKIAERYNQGLACVGDIEIVREGKGGHHVYHLYVIKTSKRDELKLHLSEMGIETIISYKTALPFTDAYKDRGFTEFDFPNAYNNQNRILSLPIFPEMLDQEVDYVIKQIQSFYIA